MCRRNAPARSWGAAVAVPGGQREETAPALATRGNLSVWPTPRGPAYVRVGERKRETATTGSWLLGTTGPVHTTNAAPGVVSVGSKSSRSSSTSRPLCRVTARQSDFSRADGQRVCFAHPKMSSSSTASGSGSGGTVALPSPTGAAGACSSKGGAGELRKEAAIFPKSVSSSTSSVSCDGRPSDATGECACSAMVTLFTRWRFLGDATVIERHGDLSIDRSVMCARNVYR